MNSWNDRRTGPKAAYANANESPIPGLNTEQYERLMQTLNGETASPKNPQKHPVANMTGKHTVNFDKIWVIDW